MLTFTFSPFPTLTTERLTLRQLRPTDAPALFALRRDPRVMQYIPRPLARSVEDAAEYIAMVNELMGQQKLINWAIAGRADDVVLGTIGYFGLKPEHFRAEIGYMLHPDYHGQGLMQEALAVVLAYGFGTLGLHSVEAIIAPENAPSARLLERNGFVREAYFREKEFYDGKFLDSVYFSLLEPGSR